MSKDRRCTFEATEDVIFDDTTNPDECEIRGILRIRRRGNEYSFDFQDEVETVFENNKHILVDMLKD